MLYNAYKQHLSFRFCRYRTKSAHLPWYSCVLCPSTVMASPSAGRTPRRACNRLCGSPLRQVSYIYCLCPSVGLKGNTILLLEKHTMIRACCCSSSRITIAPGPERLWVCTLRDLWTLSMSSRWAREQSLCSDSLGRMRSSSASRTSHPLLMPQF